MNDVDEHLRKLLSTHNGEFPKGATHYSPNVDWLFYKIVDGRGYFFNKYKDRWQGGNRDDVILVPLPVDFLLDNYEAMYD